MNKSGKSSASTDKADDKKEKTKSANPRVDPKFAATFRLWDSLKLYIDGLSDTPSKDELQMIGQAAFLTIKPYCKSPQKDKGKGKGRSDAVLKDQQSAETDDPIIAAHRLPSPFKLSKEAAKELPDEERKARQVNHMDFVSKCAETYSSALKKLAKASRKLHTEGEGKDPFATCMAKIKATETEKFRSKENDQWAKIANDVDWLTASHFTKHTCRVYQAFQIMHGKDTPNIFHTIATNLKVVIKGIEEQDDKPFDKGVLLFPEPKAQLGLCPSLLALASPHFRKEIMGNSSQAVRDALKTFLEEEKAKVDKAEQKALNDGINTTVPVPKPKAKN